MHEIADGLAHVADLEQRIRDLELHCGLVPGYSSDISSLVELYLDAMRTPALDELTARHWGRQFNALTVTAVLGLAREMNDPWAWRPFLRIADLYVDAGISFEEPRRHILNVARQLLNIQELRLISPRDVMGHPLPSMDRLFPITKTKLL